MSPRLPLNVLCRKIRNFARSFCLIFPLLLFNTLTSSAASPGSLDQSFGTGGTVNTPIGTQSVATAVLIQPDGKIIVGGYAENGSNFADFALRRYLPNGAIDTGFGDNGIVLTDFRIDPNQATRDYLSHATLQPDGKIVVGGFAGFPAVANQFTPRSAYAIARYNPNGSLDTTFSGDGKIIGEIWYNVVAGVAIQPDGKIVYTGTRGRCGDCSGAVWVEIFRVNPDGSPDLNFGVGGKVTTEMLQSNMKARAMRLQPDGKIVIGGTAASFAGEPGFAVARLKTDGNPDTDFNGGGIVFQPSFTSPTEVSDIALQPDGKIVAGRTTQTGSNPDFEITRLNPDGAFDNSFGTAGRVITAPSSFFDILGEIVVQPNGKIIVAGQNMDISAPGGHIGAFLVRYNPNGTLDPVFGTGGIARTPGGYIAHAALQPDGKIVTAGGAFSVMRYLANGSRDFDFDGDAKADISVFRPSNGDWYITRSSNGAFSGTNFGSNGDLIAPADFDGDAKTDISVFRPSTGSWYRLNSANNSFSAVQFGASSDLPVPGDFDGDGRADIAVYRPSNGNWYRLNSSNNQFVGVQFGIAEDKPIIGDFDGDGKSDLAVFRPSNGTWYRLNSSNDTFSAHQFGIAEDKPVAADYDADGKTDLSVFRPSNGYWYRINSGNNSFSAHQFGIMEDKPAPADYDGDGRADLSVFRPSNGTWYLMRSTAGFTGVQFGANADIPTPNAFVR